MTIKMFRKTAASSDTGEAIARNRTTADTVLSASFDSRTGTIQGPLSLLV
ncbi:MAG: hypothetical protein AAGD23_01645 [Pseudomonadota bacterium]